MDKKLVVAVIIVIVAIGITTALFLLQKASSLPVPPDNLMVQEIPSKFECDVLEVKGPMPIFTTPEGLSLKGGKGIQLLAEYKPPSKILVYIAFMKMPSNDIAKDVAGDIVDYVYRFKRNYTSWDYDIGGKSGYAYFDYPGLRWEMWYSGRWIIEVGTGRSGEEGKQIINDVRKCIAGIKG
ncbi:MAG: hypothetical protein J7J65_04700 [Candidatus Korarchaeota archaeon]|nr:hypothetical protein [Candidatus Korarchaeota archaeon]